MLVDIDPKLIMAMLEDFLSSLQLQQSSPRKNTEATSHWNSSLLGLPESLINFMKLGYRSAAPLLLRVIRDQMTQTAGAFLALHCHPRADRGLVWEMCIFSRIVSQSPSCSCSKAHGPLCAHSTSHSMPTASISIYLIAGKAFRQPSVNVKW